MLILLLVIFIGLIVTACLLDNNYKTESWATGCGVIGTAGTIISMIVLIGIIITYSGICAIPAKVDVLNEQNQNIEQQINIIAENYLDHESETYDKLTPDNAEIFAIAYPQLASNETVKKQMDLYIENNKTITELKLEWCMKPVYSWWIYFGE